MPDHSVRSPGRARATVLWVALVVFSACAGAQPRAPQPRPADRTLTLIDAARAAESKREYLQAQTLYEEAKVSAPDDLSRAVAARAYGRALIFYGEYKRAAAELHEAVRLRPDDAGAWHDLGMVRHKTGDDVAAERAFRQAMTAAPSDIRPRIALAALLVNHVRYAEALDEYRALSRLRLPERLRESVTWAIETLERQARDKANGNNSDNGNNSKNSDNDNDNDSDSGSHTRETDGHAD